MTCRMYAAISMSNGTANRAPIVIVLVISQRYGPTFKPPELELWTESKRYLRQRQRTVVRWWRRNILRPECIRENNWKKLFRLAPAFSFYVCRQTLMTGAEDEVGVFAASRHHKAKLLASTRFSAKIAKNATDRMVFCVTITTFSEYLFLVHLDRT